MPHTLQGLTVIDLTQNVAGPYCTQLLGDFGATVLKVERPGEGDDTRSWAPSWQGEATAFLALNRNKKSICIDLDHQVGREVLRKLLAKADLFVHSMKPASAEKRGFGYDRLSAVNQALIYCSISGFGEKGPLKDLPGYDPLIQAYTGIMSVTGHPDAPPARAGVSIVDMATGMWAFIGIMAAVIERSRTGKGSKVSASLMETGIAWTALVLTNYMATGRIPEKAGSTSPLIAPYEAFRTADSWVLIAAANDRLFVKLCDVLGRRELASDPRFQTNKQRVANRAELHRIIEELTIGRPCAEWVRVLREGGVPCSEVRTVDALCGDPQVDALEMLKAVSGFSIPDFRIIDLPVSVNGERAVISEAPPVLGSHTDEVLRWAGFSAGEIDNLKNQRAVS